MGKGALVPGWVYAALAGMFLWLGLRWFERTMLYAPDRTLWAHPYSYGIKFEEVYLRAADAVKVHAWWVPAEKVKPAILFCHGNAGNMSNRVDKIRIFHDLGASVMVFDYRGFGRSSGKPSEQGTYRDAEAAYEHLTKVRGVDPKDIVIYGESLGCAVAVEMAARRKAGALVIESPFTSVVDMGEVVLPWLPARWIVKFRYDNLAKIGKVACPLLVMHSPGDDIVPYAMGRKLFEAASEPKEFFALRGDHNEGFLTTGAAYGERLKKFFDDRLPPRRM